MSIDHVCANCGGPLRAQQAIYCTDKCRMKAYRARKADKARPLSEKLRQVLIERPKSGKLINAEDLSDRVDIADVTAWADSLNKHLKPR